MAIAPPSDIVLDTLMAADPARSQEVAARLAQLRPSRPGDFDTTLVDPAALEAVAPRKKAAPATTSLPRQSARIDTAAASRSSIPPAYRKFEAFVLQTFIEAMLPHDSDVNFGKGVAGNVWRSMMAEQLGTAVANAGGVGIAKYLAAAHPVGTAGAQPAQSRPLTATAVISDGPRSAAAAMLDDLAAKT
jgi:Rod binding domain-containing protein